MLTSNLHDAVVFASCCHGEDLLEEYHLLLMTCYINFVDF